MKLIGFVGDVIGKADRISIIMPVTAATVERILLLMTMIAFY